jgi:hypothetical protein
MVLLWAHAVIGRLFGDTGFVREIYANMKPIFPALAGSFASCISSYRKGTGNTQDSWRLEKLVNFIFDQEGASLSLLSFRNMLIVPRTGEYEIWALVLVYLLEALAVTDVGLSECNFEGIPIDSQHHPFSVLHGSVRSDHGAQRGHVNRSFGSDI